MMKKGIAQFTAFCMAAGMTFTANSMVSLAAGTDMALVGIGSTTKVNNDTVSDETTASGETADETLESSEAAWEPLDTSMVDTMGISQCEEYINIRSSADTEGEILGKLYNNSAVYIEGVDENGWYKVKSGNVEGYVAAQYIAVGSEADNLASQVGYHVAEVGAEVLNVRASASEDADVITTVTNTQEVEVVEDCGEWLKVAVDSDCYGYVSVEYVNAEMQYKVAESIEEEQARLDAEYQQYLDEQAAAEAEYAAYVEAQNNAYVEPQDNSYQEAWNEVAQAQENYDIQAQATVDAQAAADAQYQAYLDAQAEADAATEQADEQLVWDTAAEAQSQYQAYLDAQAEADAQAQAEADAASQVQAANEAAQQAEYSEVAADYTEDGYAETYTEDDYTEDSYEEEYVEDAGNYSLGQEIANYACQFVGNPYVWGGSSLTNGADCSGFTMAVMAQFGISLPHNAAAQSGYGTPVSLDSLQPGDLLFYNGDGGIGHVTMYIGNGQVVHASNSSTGIIISSISYRTPCAARRYI